MKKITILVASEEDDHKIEFYIKEFIRDHFQNYKTAKIKIENE